MHFTGLRKFQFIVCWELISWIDVKFCQITISAPRWSYGFSSLEHWFDELCLLILVLNQTFMSLDKPHLIMMCNLFTYCLIWFANILLHFLACVHYQYSFVILSFSYLDVRASSNELGTVSFYFIFWKDLCKFSIIS